MTVQTVAVKIDPASPEHTYQQLARLLRGRIQSGEITSVLPSLFLLQEETGLSANTVRRAIRVLADEGLVVTVPGRGTFVRESLEQRP